MLQKAMNKGTLTLSITFLIIGLLGGVLVIANIWVKTGTEQHSPLTPLPPSIDGAVSYGEYANKFYCEETGMNLYWSVIDDRAYFAITSPAQGWLAIGFAPDGPMMRGSDIVIGYVKEGVASLEDHFGYSQISHRLDADLGGQDDILSYAGTENESGTTFEFVRLLAAADELSKPITEGQMFIQLAYGDQDKFSTYHVKRASVTVEFFSSDRRKP